MWQKDHKQQQQKRRYSSHNLFIYKSLVIPLILIIFFNSLCDVTDACSSRTTPKPRPTTPKPRPNITFHTYKCPDNYANWYCLNGATCFTIKIGVEVLYNCECPDGYIGPRCDYKDLDGSYLSARPRVMLETASITGGVVAALFLAIVCCFFVYVRWHQGKKRGDMQDEIEQQLPHNSHSIHETNGHFENGGYDTVDGQTLNVNLQEPYYCCQSKSQMYFNSNLSSNNQTNGDNSNASCSVSPQIYMAATVPPDTMKTQSHYQKYIMQAPLRIITPTPKRPFGPHHDHAVSMSDVLLKR